MSCRRILSTFVVLGLAVSASAATFVVDINGTGQFTAIQPAIDAATDGDTVFVKPGEYVIAEPINFKGMKITVQGEAGPEATTIRMSETPTHSNRASLVVFESGEGTDSRLEGFRLTGGTGILTEGILLYQGGGVYCSNSSPALTNCTISGNSANRGGGVYCLNSSPRLTNCTISSNSAKPSCRSGPVPVCTGAVGGGVFCLASSLTLTDCTITGNSAKNGGGLYCGGGSSLILTNCTIAGNRITNIGLIDKKGPLAGGGVYCGDGSSLKLTNCRISGNEAELLAPILFGTQYIAGLGVCCENSSPILTNCTISGNMPVLAGSLFCGAGSSPTLTNCTISWNSGIGVYCGGGSPTLTNCTIAANLGHGIYCEGGSPTLTNCIVWGNNRGGFVGGNEICGRISFCLTDRDPLFVNLAGGDYHLRPGSPAIDAGTSEGAPTTDIEGHRRPCGAGVDIGAYEFGDCSPTPPFARGDANSDKVINIADAIHTLGYLFAHGPAASCLDSADANDDGKVNIADAIAILGHLFGNAEPLPVPFGECGTDPTPDDVGCSSFEPCEGG